MTGALGSSASGSLASLLAGGVVLTGVFLAIAHFMRLPELTALVGTVRGRLGR
ncbi:hypothetical protein ABZ119_14650 [Streptomyces sp. NPDC006288]|uniref:hypothetical protein n=1 Tax=Streptomyces sp. NPDC006288 TaxID=3156743 RepID=UPI0033BDE5B9